MGIIDFFKKKEKREEKREEKQVNVEELEDLIKQEESILKEKEEIILNNIKEKLQEFITETNSKIETLENFDMNTKKVEERIKEISQKNLDNYIRYSKELLIKLKRMEIENPGKLIKEIDNLFSNFNKNTDNTYQKATLLVGNEILSVKQGFSDFSKNLLKILNENKEIFNDSETIINIKSILKRLERNKEENTKIEKSIIEAEEKMNVNKKQIEKYKKQIEEIKNSEEHKELLKAEEENKERIREINISILELKQAIDFKILANMFHSNQKEMQIIHEYKENFNSNFKKNNAKDLVELIEKTKLDVGKIKQKINEINNSQNKIIKNNRSSKDKINNLLGDVTQKKSQINELQNDIEKARKRLETKKENRNEIVEELTRELEKINVILNN